MGRLKFSHLWVSILIPVIGIVAPIVWDWWTSNFELTIEQNQPTVLVEKKGKISELEIIYKEKTIDNLSKTTFKLQNTGRKPIMASDFVEPLIIKPINSNILQASIETQYPNNLKSTLAHSSNNLTIGLRLLNPGDFIVISLLTDNKTPLFYTTARIKNISSLKLEQAEKTISINTHGILPAIFVGLLSTFLAFISIFSTSKIIKNRKILRTLTNINHSHFADWTIEQARTYILEDLQLFNTASKRYLVNLVQSYDNPLTEEQSENLISSIITTIKDEKSVIGTFAIIIFTILGYHYSISTLFS